MGLDFVEENQYIIQPLEGGSSMHTELFETLEEKIGSLISRYTALQEEHQRVVEENARLLQEREGLKGRVDAILSKLEGV
jgi:cell division protein ZapB